VEGASGEIDLQMSNFIPESDSATWLDPTKPTAISAVILAKFARIV